jgi:hypothetical protein
MPSVGVFETKSLVEAALMFMRCGEVHCEWKGHPRVCHFTFAECSEEDVKYARNAKTEVVAREFNHALSQMKTEMYAAQHG